MIFWGNFLHVNSVGLFSASGIVLKRFQESLTRIWDVSNQAKPRYLDHFVHQFGLCLPWGFGLHSKYSLGHHRDDHCDDHRHWFALLHGHCHPADNSLNGFWQSEKASVCVCKPFLGTRKRQQI